MVRTGTELQIVAKAFLSDRKVAVTLKKNLEDLKDTKLCFPNWQVYFKDGSDWDRIFEKNGNSVNLY